MSPKKYPTLTPNQVIKILKKHKFVRKNVKGSHEKWEGFVKGKRRIVTVDIIEKDFGVLLMHTMIEQSGFIKNRIL